MDEISLSLSLSLSLYVPGHGRPAVGQLALTQECYLRNLPLLATYKWYLQMVLVIDSYYILVCT